MTGRLRGVVLAVGLSLISATSAQATDWQPLFNGKDLTGWTPVGDGKWTVENGDLIGEKGGSGYGWLLSERTYGDFVLSLRFHLDKPGNSGVQFRSWLDGEKMCGYQADIALDIPLLAGGRVSVISLT